jgi:3-oxoacyl-[acyl-carrier-protein] synthase-3
MGDGAAVFLKAVHAMTELPRKLLEELQIKSEDLHWIVPHQANLLLLKEVEKRIPGAAGKVIETVSYTGNTSGASVGIALETLLRKPELKSGDLVLLASAGGGGLAACAVLQRV